MIPGIIASVRTAVAGPTFHAYGADTDGWIRGIVTGDGDLTFARSSTATVTDWEGLVKTVLANELRIKDARRVENLFTASEDLTNAGWNAVNATKDSAILCTFTAQTGYIRQSVETLEGNTYTLSFDLRNIDGNTNLQLYTAVSASGNLTPFTVDGTLKRYSVTVLGRIGDGPVHFGVRDENASGQGQIELTELQVEEVTGQADQNPSEYVSVGVESGDYHGVGVDGVAYFEYENGNTVASNVVTEAKGSDLTTNWGALYETLATTNYCIYSEDLSNAAWVASNITKSSDGVTLPDGTAGTAETLTASAGNGTLLQSITLASAANNFSVYLQRKTGTGNIDITLDNGATWTTKTLTGVGTWDRVDVAGAAAANPIVGIRIVTSADAVQMWGAQLATATVPSSYVPTTTVAVTRTADDGDGAFAYSNFSETEGTWVVEWTPSIMTPSATYQIFGPNASSQVGGLQHRPNNTVHIHDGTVFSDVALNPTTPGNRFYLGFDFGTGSTLDCGMRDITGAGSWAWDASPASYTGSWTDNNAINIAYSTAGTTPQLFRNLYGYKTRQGKAFVEANY